MFKDNENFKEFIKEELKDEFDIEYPNKEFNKMFDVFSSALDKYKVKTVIEMSEPGDSEFPEDDEIRDKFLTDKDDECVIFYAEGNDKPFGTHAIKKDILDESEKQGLNWSQFIQNNGDLHDWFLAAEAYF